MSITAKRLVGIICNNPFSLGLVSALLTMAFASIIENVLNTKDVINGSEVNFQDALGLVAIAVVFPLMETLVFQTCIILIMVKIVNSRVLSVGVSSLVFSASHVGSSGSLPLIVESFLISMIPGIMFAYVSIKYIVNQQVRRSVFYTWITHSSHNTSILIIYGLCMAFPI